MPIRCSGGVDETLVVDITVDGACEVGKTGVDIIVVGGDKGRLQATRDATKIEITKIRNVFKVASNLVIRTSLNSWINSAG